MTMWDRIRGWFDAPVAPPRDEPHVSEDVVLVLCDRAGVVERFEVHSHTLEAAPKVYEQAGKVYELTHETAHRFYYRERA